MPSVTINTKHAPWIRYKAATNTSEDALTDGTKKGANVPSTAYAIPEAMNNLEFRVAADSEGIQATAYVYGARWLNSKGSQWDDISLIGTAVLTSGAQVSSDNYQYVDTVVLTDRWITEVKVADGNGNDGMSRIAFDASGYDCFFVKLNFASGYWLIDLSGW